MTKGSSVARAYLQDDNVLIQWSDQVFLQDDEVVQWVTKHTYKSSTYWSSEVI